MGQAPGATDPGPDRDRAGALPVPAPPTRREGGTARAGKAARAQEETRALDRVRGKAPEKGAGTNK